MTIGGAFLGGGVELVPAGSCKLVMEIRTEDGKNLATTFSVAGGGQTYTATAGADGRAELIVPSGVTYTVTTSATGYDGLTAQTVIGDSATIQYVRFEAILPRVKKSGDTMSDNLSIAKSGVSTLILKRTDANKDHPSYKQLGVIRAEANNGMSSQIEFLRNTPLGYLGSGVIISAYNSTGTQQHLSLYSFDEGVAQEAYVQHPSWMVGTNDNSDKSLTIKMANSLPSLVHTTGNEDIAGVKSFTGGWRVVNATTMDIINQGIPKDAYPTATSQRFINFKDAGNIARAGLYGGSRANDNHIGLRVYGSSNFGGIELSYNPNDNTYKVVAPTTKSDATSNEIATANWSIGKFVQKSGDTMTGNLILSWQGPPSVTNVNARITKDFAAFTTVGSFLANATDGVIGGIQVLRSTPLGYAASITNVIANNASGTDATISLVARDNNEAYVTCPAPPSKTDNSDKIPTTAWINSADVICRTAGNQTIGGAKTFTDNVTLQRTGSPLYICKHTGIESGVTGNNNQRIGLEILDSKNLVMGQFQTNYSNSLNTKSYIGAKDSKGNWRYIELHARNDGTAYAMCPNPETGDLEKIATADWVLGKVPKKTTFSTWAELNALLVNGKPGDMMCITLDYVGNSNITDFTADDVNIHAFGSFTVEELTVSSGTLTKLEAFGGGEIQYNSIRDRYFAMTGFGQMAVGDLSAWAFRVPYGGEMNLMLMTSDSVTSCTGFYVSI